MAQPPRLQAVSIPRHECRGSGACCAAFRVGPLTPDDIGTVRRHLPAVEAAFPGQLAGSPFQEQRHEGRPATFLRKVGGFCAFYRGGVGCTLHAAAGPGAKPFLCRLFPLQLVEDGEVLRIGVRPTCLSDGFSWENGPPVPGAEIAAALQEPKGVLRREEMAREDVMLELLRDPEVSSASILRALSGRSGEAAEQDAEAWLERAWSTVVETARTITGTAGAGGPLWPEDAQGPLHPRSPTGASLSEMARWWASRPDPGRWPEVHVRHLPHARNAWLRLGFLRQCVLHPTVAWALVAWVAAARWASAWAGPEDSARFGRAFATLLILLESPRVQSDVQALGPPFG